jgi:hypothetical protein
VKYPADVKIQFHQSQIVWSRAGGGGCNKKNACLFHRWRRSRNVMVSTVDFDRRTLVMYSLTCVSVKCCSDIP